MQIERDFTSGRVTLSFEGGRRIDLTTKETKEFDNRIKRVQEDAIRGK